MLAITAYVWNKVLEAGKIKMLGLYRGAKMTNPSHIVNGLTVVGTDAMAEYVGVSIGELNEKDRAGYRLVQRYLAAVVSIDHRRTNGFVARLHFEQVRVDRAILGPSARYAARLVRTAVQARMITGFNIIPLLWNDKRCMVVPLLQEFRSMLLLNCEDAYIKEQKEYVLRIAAGTDRYFARCVESIARMEERHRDRVKPINNSGTLLG
jgi:hypothetical protein